MQLTDFSYTDFTVSYIDALDRLRVHLNIVFFFLLFSLHDIHCNAHNVMHWIVPSRELE